MRKGEGALGTAPSGADGAIDAEPWAIPARRDIRASISHLSSDSEMKKRFIPCVALVGWLAISPILDEVRPMTNLLACDPSLHDHTPGLVGTGPTADGWQISAVSGVSGTVRVSRVG